MRLLSAFAAAPGAALRLPVGDGLAGAARAAADSLRLDRAALAQAVQAALPDDIRLHDAPPRPGEDARPAAAYDAHARAVQSLRVYFAQLASPAGLFLDLAPERFTYLAGDRWLWQPGPGLLRLPDSLRAGMQAMYAALYAEARPNAVAFEQALVQLGLCEADAAHSRQSNQAIVSAFQDHIGGAASGERTHFRLRDFLSRYPVLAERLSAAGTTLPAEFAHAGVYFLSLYLALDDDSDNAARGFDVGAAYRAARANPG